MRAQRFTAHFQFSFVVFFAGVRYLCDFSPEKGFSSKVMKRETDLEAGYTIKLDTLRKLKEKTEATGRAAIGAEDGDGPASAGATAAAAAASGEPPSKKVKLSSSSSAAAAAAGAGCPTLFGGAGAGGGAGDAGDPDVRDENDLLVDEYALSFVAQDATLMPDDDPFLATQSPAVSEEDEPDAAEVDLGALLRDDDEEEEVEALAADRGGDEDEEEKEGAGGRPAVARKPSSGTSFGRSASLTGSKVVSLAIFS